LAPTHIVITPPHPNGPSTTPVNRGPNAAPKDPLPSMIAVTVARALRGGREPVSATEVELANFPKGLSCSSSSSSLVAVNEGCSPRAADTVVVMIVLGPWIKSPQMMRANMSVMVREEEKEGEGLGRDTIESVEVLEKLAVGHWRPSSLAPGKECMAGSAASIMATDVPVAPKRSDDMPAITPPTMPPQSKRVENRADEEESKLAVILRKTGSQKRKLYETNLAKKRAKL